MTTEETAKILEWVGMWKAGVKKKQLDKYKCPEVICEWHDIPMPALSGDFADVVAMKCLRKLEGFNYSFAHDPDGETEIYVLDSKEQRPHLVYDKDPAQAIFRAVLAYLEQANG